MPTLPDKSFNSFRSIKPGLTLSRGLKLAFSTMGLLALAGCAQITSVPPGTSLATVEKEFGKPAVTCAGPNGTTRAIWSQMPDGEMAWATTVDARNHVGTFQQVLSPTVFEKLGQGTWTSSQVRCEFGPPATVHIFPEKPNLSVWEYRFLNEENNYMIMYVYFETATNTVTRYSKGPDPEFNTLILGK